MKRRTVLLALALAAVFVASPVHADDISGSIDAGRLAPRPYVVDYERLGGFPIVICHPSIPEGTGYGGTCFPVYPEDKTVGISITDRSLKNVMWGYAWSHEPLLYVQCGPSAGPLAVPKDEDMLLVVLLPQDPYGRLCPHTTPASVGVISAAFDDGPVAVRGSSVASLTRTSIGSS